jgi:hypothetical protein
VSYTPTFTNFTLGDGTVTARYAQQGEFTDVYIQIVIGSTTIVGTSPTISLPVTANFASITGGSMKTALNGSATYFDGNAGPSGQSVYGYVSYVDNTKIEPRIYYLSGNYQISGNSARIDATTPFTWATGDEIFITFNYHSL